MHKENQALTELLILKNAIENANEAFVTIDRTSKVIIFNKSAENIFRITKDEIIGKDLNIILGPACREGHNKAVNRYLETRSPTLIGHETEFTAMRRDGETFPALISFSVADIEGELFFTGLIRDMTETKKLQQKIIRSERLAALGQTVAEINHEIKNPLALIGGFAGQLLKKARDEKDRTKLELISSEVKRLEKLLGSLSTLYNPKKLNLEKINVIDLLKTIYSLVEEECARKSIDLRLEIDSDKIIINGDREKLTQVMLNVIKNSVEAMEKGGHITIKVNRTSNTLEIFIQDAGPGMPKEVREKIFDPFYTTKKQGSGLGLAVSKRIIDDHAGGSFTVESKEGEGTMVRICLACE